MTSVVKNRLRGTKYWYLMQKCELCLKKRLKHMMSKNILQLTNIYVIYVIRMVEKALYFLNHSLSTLTSTSVASESINAELH